MTGARAIEVMFHGETVYRKSWGKGRVIEWDGDISEVVDCRPGREDDTPYLLLKSDWQAADWEING